MQSQHLPIPQECIDQREDLPARTRPEMPGIVAENKGVDAAHLLTVIIEDDVSWLEEGCLLHC